LIERDFKKEAIQLHITFHDEIYAKLQNAVSDLEDFIEKIVGDEEAQAKLARIKDDVEKAKSQASDIVDNLAIWVGELYDKILRLQGALEEARRKW